MNNDIILIVGGAGGIGFELALQISNHAKHVIIADKDETIKEKIKKSNISFIKVDVLSIESILKLSEKIKIQFGHLTHLISMAGGALVSEFQELQNVTYEDISISIDLNLKSHIYLIKSLENLLTVDKSDNKTITLISSINALSDFGLVPYSSSKAGLYGLMNSSVNYLGNKNIRINTVSPGTVPTPRTLKEPKDFENLKQGTIANRLTTVKDVSDTIISIIYSMKSVYGQNIVIDCGQTKKAL